MRRPDVGGQRGHLLPQPQPNAAEVAEVEGNFATGLTSAVNFPAVFDEAPAEAKPSFGS